MNEVILDTRKLDELIKNTPEKADKVVREWATIITSDAAKSAPVDTGALRNSILAESPTKIGDLQYRIQDGVEYGIYQDLGTYKMAAHPFMVPAVERNWQGFVNAFKGLFT
jgi:HK97 gp10 family phage protein